MINNDYSLLFVDISGMTMKKFSYLGVVLLFSVLCYSQGKTYYSQADGNVNNLSNWNTSPSGGGTSPTNFSSGDIFEINHIMTANAQWVVSGTGSKVVIKANKSFTSSGSYDHALKLDIEDAGTYIHTSGSSLSLINGTFGTSSNFQINDPSGFREARPYGNLILMFDGMVTTSSALTVNGDLILKGGADLTVAYTLTVMGDIFTGVTSGLASNLIFSGAQTFNLYGSFDASYGAISFRDATTTINLFGNNNYIVINSVSYNSGAAFSLHLQTGSQYRLLTNLGVGGSTTVDGRLIFESASLALSSTTSFALNAGGGLKIASNEGISSSKTGNIRCYGSATFSSEADYEYSGSGSQNTGDLLPSSLSGNLIISNANSVTLTNSINTTGAVTVSGVLKMGGKTISGAGSFTLNSGASIYIDNPEGISSSGSTGSIQTTTRNFHSYGHYWYNGVLAQVTGTGLPALQYGTLGILNAAGVTLSKDTEVRTIHLQGRLLMGDYDLTLSPGLSISGSEGSLTNMIVQNGTGRLIIRFDEQSQTQVPVGDYSSGSYRYSLFSLYVNASAFNSARVTLEILRGKHSSNTSAENYLTRTWSFTGTGFTSPTVNLYIQYDQNDVTGDESQIYGARYDGSLWNIMGQVNAINNTFEQTSMTGFYTVTGGEESALPVELLSFSGKLINGKVELRWETATEVDNSGFAIERNISDKWQQIGFVEGCGTSNSVKYYRFVDRDFTGSSIKYRLNQLDNDGSNSYSDVITIDALPDEFALYQNYPNPFSSESSVGNGETKVKFTLPKTMNITLKLFDISGREVNSILDGQIEAEIHAIKLSGKNLSSGVYILRLIGEGKTKSVKLIVQK